MNTQLDIHFYCNLFKELDELLTYKTTTLPLDKFSSLLREIEKIEPQFIHSNFNDIYTELCETGVAAPEYFFSHGFSCVKKHNSTYSLYFCDIKSSQATNAIITNFPLLLFYSLAFVEEDVFAKVVPILSKRGLDINYQYPALLKKEKPTFLICEAARLNRLNTCREILAQGCDLTLQVQDRKNLGEIILENKNLTPSIRTLIESYLKSQVERCTIADEIEITGIKNKINKI